MKERLKETDTEFENARKRAKKSKQTFEKVKRERYDKFMKCFDHVSNKIDEIYKVRTKISLFIIMQDDQISVYSCIFCIIWCNQYFYLHLTTSKLLY